MAFSLGRWLRDSGGAMLAGLATIAAVALLRALQPAPIDRVGLLLFDSFQRAAPRVYEDAPVRAVLIDEESIRRLGQWPWPRSDIARLNDRLAGAGAAAIAYDVVFSEPDRTSPAAIAERLQRGGNGDSSLAALARLPDHDTLLAQSLAKSRAVTGYFLENRPGRPAEPPKAGFAVAGSAELDAVPEFAGAVQSLPALQAAASGSGFISLGGASDGILREVPLLARQNGQLLPSLSLDALRVAQGAGAIVVRTGEASGEAGDAPGKVVAVKVGDIEVPVSESGALWIHYTSPRPERSVPAWEVLDGSMDAHALEQAFGGRIVFVGASAVGLRDLAATPLNAREPGVLIHAQAAEQMLLGHFLERPDWARGAEMAALLLFGLGLVLALPRLGAVRGALLAAVLAGGLVWASWFAFARHRMLLDPTWPVLAILLAYLVVTAVAYFREEKRRAFIHQAFGRYLAPELVRRIAARPGLPELGGEEREMTVLSCDIRSFTHIAEGLTPKETIGFLNAFQTPMCDILLAHQATLDKYVGDAVLAFWNAPLDDPDQYEHAAQAALAMAAELARLNREEPQGNGPQENGSQEGAMHWPGGVRIGIGMNAGPCLVGNMGSRQRLSYSLVGDTVNLACRIEGLTKFYGVTIAMGEDLQKRLPGHATLELDRVRVVGREKPEAVHALLGDRTLTADPAFASLAASHDAFLAAYRTGAFTEALTRLAGLDAMAPSFGLEALYRLYRERIEHFAEHPPGEGWDAVFAAPHK